MKGRNVIAVNTVTKEKRKYENICACAADLGVSKQNALQQLNRNGMIGAWRLFDTVESLKRRIFELERQIREVESL